MVALTNFLRKVQDEFIYGGHLVALGPVIISYIFIRLSGLALGWSLMLGIYLIVYIIHLLDRFIDISKDTSSDRSMHYASYKKMVPVMSLISFSLLIFIMSKNGIKITFIAIAMTLSGILYSLFFKKITRYILGFKSYYVALTFGSVVFFSAYYYGQSLSITVFFLYAFFVLRWFCNTTFCDLKDIEPDKTEGLKTFAIKFKKRRLYFFFYLINIFSFLPITLGIMYEYLPNYSLMLILAPIYYFYYLTLSQKTNADYQKLANVWADGESLVWLLAIIVGGQLWG